MAVAVVGSIGHRFTGGGAFVDLVGVVPGFVAQSVAEAFGVGELPLRSHVDAVVGRIGVSAPLLVVDNGDRLIDETACTRNARTDAAVRLARVSASG